MIDATEAFRKQFVPFEGAYLLYSSRKGGGKLVTSAEYEQLVADWQRIAGRRGQWKIVGVVLLVILIWTLVSRLIEVPGIYDQLMILGIALAVTGRILWASLAPQRLVRHREAVVPPRPSPEARREARALLAWPLITFVALLSGAIFLLTLNAPERTLSWWAWLIGSGAMFGCYLWIGFQKFRDREP